MWILHIQRYVPIAPEKGLNFLEKWQHLQYMEISVKSWLSLLVHWSVCCHLHLWFWECTQKWFIHYPINCVRRKNNQTPQVLKLGIRSLYTFYRPSSMNLLKAPSQQLQRTVEKKPRQSLQQFGEFNSYLTCMWFSFWHLLKGLISCSFWQYWLQSNFRNVYAGSPHAFIQPGNTKTMPK